MQKINFSLLKQQGKPYKFFLLYSKDQERLREKERVKRYKSFLDIKKEVEDEIPEPSDDEEPKLTPQQQKIINKLKL